MGTIDRRQVVEAFCKECVWLHSVRRHFADLFESNDSRSQLLSEVANTFFHDLNLILIDYILLHQCKLTDPASSGVGKDNLTTNFMLLLSWTTETKDLLQEQNALLIKFREKIVDARRKLVAHLDLRARLTPVGLGSFTAADEAEFWQALQDFVNTAHEEAVGGPFEIDAAMQGGDVASLIHSLKDAIDYNDLANHEDGFLLRRFGNRRYDDA
jgi:AbiU2